jgi:tRNA pseudouridine65 synthase/23S rRNA pseudouridine1911/1915/1917 synthase
LKALIIDTIEVKKVEPSVRLSDFLINKSVHLPSNKSIKKALKKGLIFKNGVIAYSGDYVQENDLIELQKEDLPVKKTFPLELEVVFEDEHLAVINKPAGYPVSGNYFKTIENALPHNLKPSLEKDALEYPRCIHRLDNPTSGLLIVAKTKKARVFLGQELEKGKLDKSYMCITQGKMTHAGLLQMPIDNKTAITKFKVMESVPSLRSGQLNLVTCKIETGRTHQIRKHLSSIGHPILGDKEYGQPGNVLLGKGMFLCAYQLSFVHPVSREERVFKLNPPSKFLAQLQREKDRFRKFRT